MMQNSDLCSATNIMCTTPRPGHSSLLLKIDLQGHELWIFRSLAF